MKLIIALMFAMLTMTSAFAVNGTLGRSTALDFAKAVIPETVEKLSINVKNVHSAEIAKGMAVVADLTADDGASVIISTTSGLSPLCVMEKACAVNALCPCQRYGIFSDALFDSTAASAVAGKRFFMSTQNAGYLAARSVDLATEVSGGFFYDAASASGNVQIFLK